MDFEDRHVRLRGRSQECYPREALQNVEFLRTGSHFSHEGHLIQLGQAQDEEMRKPHPKTRIQALGALREIGASKSV
jgi:hypothetical protein